MVQEEDGVTRGQDCGHVAANDHVHRTVPQTVLDGVAHTIAARIFRHRLQGLHDGLPTGQNTVHRPLRVARHTPTLLIDPSGADSVSQTTFLQRAVAARLPHKRPRNITCLFRPVPVRECQRAIIGKALNLILEVQQKLAVPRQELRAAVRVHSARMQRHERIVVEGIALHGTVLQRPQRLHELLKLLISPVMDLLACPPLHAIHLESVLALVRPTMVHAAVRPMNAALAAKAGLQLSLLRSRITTSVAAIKAVGAFLASPSFITEAVKVRIVRRREARIGPHASATLTRLVLSLLDTAGRTHRAHPVAGNHRPKHSPLHVD
mmetsp:Transcript_32867/g.79174  ORF Transcript_32867/g.79174 Transcript_32867/m.79174 type:complete len:322 (-) Transcript_32867:1339-2304(-)